MVQKDATVLRKERLHRIYRMLKGFDKGLDLKTFLGVISWNIGLTSKTAVKYIDEMIDFGKITKDELDIYHAVFKESD